MSEVTNRNIQALAQAARKDRDLREGLETRITHLERLVAMQNGDIQQLKSQITCYLALRGSGPTSR